MNARESVPSPSEVPDAPLTVAAVAARLGVAASTLRTWDRRYGLGPTAHEAGSHRRYSPSDVARLDHMRSLTLQGVAPADAARRALAEEPEGHPAPSASMTHLHVVGEDDILADPLTLVAAALKPDQERTERLLVRAIARLGIVRTWVEIVRPGLRILRDKSRMDRHGIEPDAIVAVALCAALRAAVPQTPTSRGKNVAIVSGTNGTVPGQVIGAELTRRGADVHLVRPASGDGPTQVLAALRDLGARVVLAVGALDLMDGIMREVSASGDLVGYLVGRAAPDLWLPNVHRVRTVPAAVEEVAACLDL
ncbi:MAG: MerR family transcriptional regulator [Bowdeniella nasicola]|nr:MerR family transcriptional regulator [Bowdeniella nasicola]